MEQLLIEHEIVPKQSQREKPAQISPLVWLNLVCLDAPLVAVSWQWLFARAFQVPLTISVRLTLFLTAWLIYLADRLADSWALIRTEPLSLRQRFCRRHQRIWIVAIPLLALADCILISQQLDRDIIRVGLVVGALSLVYLSVNYWLGKMWRFVPVKEVCIGCLFASGTVAAVVPQVGSSAMFLVAFAFFAALCSLNCIGIAIWERDLDLTQARIPSPRAGPIFVPGFRRQRSRSQLARLSSDRSRKRQHRSTTVWHSALSCSLRLIR